MEDKKKTKKSNDLAEGDQEKVKIFSHGFGSVEEIQMEKDVVDIYATYSCGGYYNDT